MGSKNRIAKEIIPIMLKDYEDGMIFIDACCGGCNLIDKIPNHIPRYANDINEYLIEMFIKASKGWIPPKYFTEDEYKNVRDNKDNDKALTGYAGFALSYGGKWFGGWCRDGKGIRNYVEESYKNSLKQFPLLKNVIFSNKSVFDINPIKKSIIYFDIPYKGTTKYKNDFDHYEFYRKCRKLKKQGHIIFISEYNMPNDFTCVWEKEVNSSLTKNTGSKKATEKLFTL